MNIEILTVALGFCNCHVIKGHGVVAIDAGEPGKEDRFAAGLSRAGIRPTDVKLIVLTHGHWDHVGSAKAIKAITGAPLAMHEREIPWLENALTPLPPGVTPWGRVLMAVHRLFMPFVRVPSVTVELSIGNDGLSLEKFGIPGRVFHTPGHSSGSVSVLLDTGQAFVGDLAMNRLPLRMSPGLPIFAEDLSEVMESWRMLIENGATTVYPAHGDPFPVSVIDKAIRSAA